MIGEKLVRTLWIAIVATVIIVRQWSADEGVEGRCVA